MCVRLDHRLIEPCAQAYRQDVPHVISGIAYPWLDAERGLIFASNGYMLAVIDVGLTYADSGPIPLSAFELARKHKEEISFRDQYAVVGDACLLRFYASSDDLFPVVDFGKITEFSEEMCFSSPESDPDFVLNKGDFRAAFGFLKRFHEWAKDDFCAVWTSPSPLTENLAYLSICSKKWARDGEYVALKTPVTNSVEWFFNPHFLLMAFDALGETNRFNFWIRDKVCLIKPHGLKKDFALIMGINGSDDEREGYKNLKMLHGGKSD